MSQSWTWLSDQDVHFFPFNPSQTSSYISCSPGAVWTQASSYISCSQAQCGPWPAAHSEFLHLTSSAGLSHSCCPRDALVLLMHKQGSLAWSYQMPFMSAQARHWHPQLSFFTPRVHDPLRWHHGPMGRHEVPPSTELSSKARLSGELRPWHPFLDSQILGERYPISIFHLS